MLNNINKLYYYNILLRHKYIIFHFIRISLHEYVNYSYFINKFKVNKKNKIEKMEINNTHTFNLIYKKRVLSSISYSSYNSYFYIYFINKDYWINTFLNLLTKNGRKFASYKIFHNILINIKKLVGINPLFLFKKQLYQNRLLFDIQQLKLRKKTLVIPKLLSSKSQIIKSIRYLLNNFSLSNMTRIGKNDKIFNQYQKLSYIILNNLFNENVLKNLIGRESSIIKNNFFYIRKENFSKKYLNEMDSDNILKKHSLFRKKFKSLTKKDKYLKYYKSKVFIYKRYIDEKKLFLFDRFQLNLQSKLKLKTKWF